MFGMDQEAPDQTFRLSTRTPAFPVLQPDWPECASLSGVIPFGGAPQLYRPAHCPTWSHMLYQGERQIAIDGYFVASDRLLTGGTAQDRVSVLTALDQDPLTFLNSVQNGFFNIVVNDFGRGETWIANDVCGGLPLYLLRETDRVIFSSTYAGLRRLAAKPLSIDPVGAAELYWLGYPLGNRTVFRGVELTPPGTVTSIRWSDGTCRSKRYVAQTTPPQLPSTRGEMAEQVLSMMRAATKRLHRPDVCVGIKLSAGMDSRLICASSPTPPSHAYTYGDSGSAEVRIARKLAQALGMNHTAIPIQGDFFSALHAPFFELHGITEFFHQATLPPMRRDGIRFALDGLGGDVLLGGLTLRRSHGRVRDALGLTPAQESMPQSDEQMADYILRQIRVADHQYRPLTRSAAQELDGCWNSIRADMTGEVQQARRTTETSGQLYTEVMFNNRTRRYISLQGTLCRPGVETLYPFLDRDFLRLRGRIPAEWISGKRLYLEIFSRLLPSIRSVPGLMSLLPFGAPPSLHFAGRIVRYGRERAGLRVSHWTHGKVSPWAANGVQWARWLAFNRDFREGAHAFMRTSAVFDEAAWQRATDAAVRSMQLTGTRFMLTASYCGHFRA